MGNRYKMSTDEQHRRNVLIVFLRDSEGLSFPVIAKRFGISQTAAWQIYHKVKGTTATSVQGAGTWQR